MAQDLKTIGDHLKRRRTELNLSLKEAENATSIRQTQLQSIEEGHIDKLISPVYAQGFVKQYAAFLGLDGEKIIRDNVEVFHKNSFKFSPEKYYDIGSLEIRGNPGSSVKWMPNLAWGAAFVAMLVIGWYVAKFFDIF